MGWGGGWLEKSGIKLSHLSTEVEVEVEDELGNTFVALITKYTVEEKNW